MDSMKRTYVRRWLLVLALLAGASAAASSCSDPSPVGVTTPPMLAAQKVGGGRLLSCPVAITAVAPSQSVNLVRFRPEGLKFKPGAHGIGALVATNLDYCNVHPNQVLQIVHVDDALSILGYLQAPTSTDSAVVVKYKTYLGSLWVGGLLQHFSNYAVAW